MVTKTYSFKRKQIIGQKHFFPTMKGNLICFVALCVTLCQLYWTSTFCDHFKISFLVWIGYNWFVLHSMNFCKTWWFILLKKNYLNKSNVINIILLNWFKTIKNWIDANWVNLTIETFTQKCTKYFITVALLLYWSTHILILHGLMIKIIQCSKMTI